MAAQVLRLNMCVLTGTLLALIMSPVRADYTLIMEVRALASGQLANNSCCEGGLTDKCSCGNVTLSVCLSEIGSGDDCSLWDAVYEGSTNSTTVIVSPVIEGAWPIDTGAELTITAYNTGNTTAIDTFSIQVNLSLSEPSLLLTHYEGDMGMANVSLSLMLTCADNHYSLDCSVFCVPSNDSTGYYTCNESDGSVVCLNGYTNTTVNCTQCIPASGCSAVGGYCNLPGECLCLPGFTGPQCENAMQLSLMPTSTAIQLTHSNHISLMPHVSTSQSTLIQPTPVTPSHTFPPPYQSSPSLPPSPLTKILVSPSRTVAPTSAVETSHTNNTLLPVETMLLTTPLPSPSGTGRNDGVVAGAVIGSLLVVLVVVAIIAVILGVLLSKRRLKSRIGGSLWYIKANPSLHRQKISHVKNSNGDLTKSLRSIRSLTPDFLVVRPKHHKSTVPNGGNFLRHHPAVSYNMNTSSQVQPPPPAQQWPSEPGTLSSTEDATLPRHIRSPSAETESSQPPGGTSTAASSLSRLGKSLKVYQMPSFEDDSIILTNMGVETGELNDGADGGNVEHTGTRQTRVNSKSL